MSKFITVDKVLELTQASLNTDPCLIETEIELSAKRYFKTCIGADLFNELCDQIENDTITTENQSLLDVIEPSLARYVLFEALPMMHLQVASNGILMNDTQFSKQVDLKGVTYLRQNVLAKAEFLKDCVLEFLEDNAVDYPLYESKCDNNCNNNIKNRIIFY